MSSLEKVLISLILVIIIATFGLILLIFFSPPVDAKIDYSFSCSTFEASSKLDVEQLPAADVGMVESDVNASLKDLRKEHHLDQMMQ
jgi:hypothetical protein